VLKSELFEWEIYFETAFALFEKKNELSLHPAQFQAQEFRSWLVRTSALCHDSVPNAHHYAVYRLEVFLS
jgi:hypothetical protein